MTWMLMAIAVWTAVAVTLALLIGRSIRVADTLDDGQGQPIVPDFVPADWVTPTAGPR